jgi:hypothetical protein
LPNPGEEEELGELIKLLLAQVLREFIFERFCGLIVSEGFSEY